MASAQMKALTDIMKKMMAQQGMPMFGGGADPMILRATMEAAQKNMPMEPGVKFLPERFGEMEAEICLPENAREDAVIAYIHGGGLICGNAFTSRGYGSMLAGETKIPVYTFSYRLAPENPYPAAVDDCFNAYAEMVQRYPDKSIFLVGESGGGYLCLTTALRAKSAGMRMPAGLIPYSPVVDMSGTLDRSRNAEKDFTVTPEGLDQLRDMFCPDESLWRTPDISPMFGDYAGFPPMLLAWDADETLAVDSEKLVEICKDAGVTVEYKSYPECFHAFATTGRGTPESAEILKDTVAFMERLIEASSPVDN